MARCLGTPSRQVQADLHTTERGAEIVAGLSIAGSAEVTLWITIGFTAIGLVLWWAGGIGLLCPDIRAWIRDNKPLIQSPLLFARSRRF